ncbi:GntR family transcriptional regulator [Falsirhodobacter halotolerans]|uniref:GntR family transcriptional regulator n=1 Tax=Falsirhodobacter halotolerans TaxID=1146892 RepID=UPI001FD3A4E1|nr:GntR family transcriptional regulator [Falsirhodobacter halotolerans]MCJ8139866.1 GntR family transcriptional regulator [Falsirhodobacter halotolerans]
MNVTETVYTNLRRKLMAGRYDPGTHLKEEIIAGDMGVSRTPVRAAFARLIAEGLLSSGVKRGAIVTEWRKEHVAEIFSLRILLEGQGAYLSASHATPEQLDLMERTCDAMEAAFAARNEGWQKALDEGNRVIHELLYDASGSPYLRLSGRHLLDVQMVMGGFFIYSDPDVEESLRHHRELHKALTLGNGDWARAVMACHLSAATERFLRGDDTQ